MNSSTEQLYAILNRKWQPDDDRYVLELDGPEPDGKCTFAWIDTAHGYPLDFPLDRPEPSIGEWSVEGAKLVLRSGLTEDRDEYAVEHNADGDELTLTDPDGRSRRFTRAGETETEHPASKAARYAKYGLPPPRVVSG